MKKEDEEKKEEEIIDDITIVESTEDGLELPDKDKNKKLREDVKRLQKEKDEYLLGWQRAKADYINLQRELEAVRLNSSLITKEKVVENILPALDSFEMAFSNQDFWQKVDKNWRQGIESIYDQIISGLNKSDIEKIDQVDILFDPNIHQSIEKIKTDDKGKDHFVESILQVGYKVGNRTIRPAKVRIFEFENKNHS
ncbi:MAG TPA: nucleotide exchange factor GrpE [Candidatus Paceibacterota bacterium]|jgi:molecular chaperone GrpE|nr:nucleotide exchange factor GrpE [Candidatus Paceibacterota bacterium]HOX90915.1 nucleotide exchange factor GrpE [Candidatus Paceibacterota bacterium]HPC12306.1 nucleotide exchange factor GrpE [Candidatus Paceibacterota bacterium]HQC45968.1 nucleotide exchange factor GrpE [Candidatus Paceibacterota bacterium]HQM18578.1 nucleotide exchange factor GrpE [Candidatus Paceibacterota bacterium]